MANNTSTLTLAQTKMLLEKSRTFGTPGASLTWGVKDFGKGEVTAGLEGEQATGKILNNYVNTSVKHLTVFHSVQWPGNTNGDTDHVLLSGKNVYIIDSKKWKTKRKYSVTQSGTILRGTVRFPEGKVKILSALQTWRNILPDGVRVKGIVCIAQKDVFVPYDQNWQKAPFKLVTLNNLTDFFDRNLSTPPTEAELLYEPHIALPILQRLIKPKPGPKKINFS